MKGGQRGMGRGRGPTDDSIEDVKSELENILPEGYQIEEGEVSRDVGTLMAMDGPIHRVKNEEGEEVAEIGYNLWPIEDKISNIHYTVMSTAEDEVYSTLCDFVDEGIDEILIPDRSLEGVDKEKVVQLSYKNQEVPKDEAEREQFRKAVEALERAGVAQLDPEYTDDDVFYKRSDAQPAVVATEDYQELKNFMRGTELYVEGSFDPKE